MTTPNPRVPNPFMGRSSLSRRQLIKRAGAFGAAGLSLQAFLTACGGSSDDDASSGSSPGSSPGTAGGGSSPAGGGGSNLYFENWPLYIDPTADGLTGTVDRFVAATGIDMQYTEAYNDNNEYFAKIQPVPRQRRHDRPRHHRADVVADRPAHPARLGRQASARPDPQRGEPAARPRRSRRGTRPASTRSRGRRASAASPTTSTSPGASSRRPTTCSTRRSRARSACSPRCATRWASS